MYNLGAASPDEAFHMADLPWRLSSAAMPERGRRWETAWGAVVAWAVHQFPAWHCLDYVIRPYPRTPDLEAVILAWACARA